MFRHSTWVLCHLYDYFPSLKHCSHDCPLNPGPCAFEDFTLTPPLTLLISTFRLFVELGCLSLREKVIFIFVFFFSLLYPEVQNRCPLGIF